MRGIKEYENIYKRKARTEGTTHKFKQPVPQLPCGKTKWPISHDTVERNHMNEHDNIIIRELICISGKPG